ncbi:MAG TPA: putative Ig domain-containing protein, partial [Candidatus Sulfotelmatobacter sp.]|nr:putative Ig domain-containing protein [Candidatus Sulfotelmatobacter sp.]
LPEGLSLDSGSGTISGTPSRATSTETYTVTALTATGNAVGTVSITVDDVAPWSQFIPNMDQTITPLAPPGSQYQQLNPDLADNPAWLASQAATTALSPDGNTLLILTTGYNREFNDEYESLTSYNPVDSNEYVFVYDVSSGAPIKKQVLPVAVAYFGIAWDPSGAHFYVTGCSMDDVHIFTYNSTNQLWAEENAVWDSQNSVWVPKLTLGHGTTGVGLGVYPCAAGIAVSPSGKTMVVANYYNDSLSILTGGYGNWALEDVSGDGSKVYNLDLRPGKDLVAQNATSGVPGGEYPFWVVITGDDTATPSTAVAYVSSIRDREIDVVPLSAATNQPLQVTTRIAVKGQPNKMVLNSTLNVLYVAEDQSDTVDVIDVSQDPKHYMTVNTVIETIPVLAPAGLLPSSFYYSGSNSASALSNPIYTGSNTNSLALSPGGSQLYVTNGNLNDVAVVQLTGTNSGDSVVGLIPTGWYPNSVSTNASGTWMYVANAKSPTSSNPGWCYSYGPASFIPNCFSNNQYNPQLTKAGLQSFPIPTVAQLQTLTAQVAQNDRFSSTESGSDQQIMAAVSKGVQHVIYILKENRTYDQVLGDLTDAKGVPIGEQEPSLVQWGQAITPNLHNLARTFVTLDHFFATSEVSVDGWAWSTAAQCPDIIEHEFPVAYAFRALALEAEGANRNVSVALPTLAQRLAANPLLPNDPDLFPGQTGVGAPDGPNNEINTGHLWDAALRAGLTVRNYGFFLDCYRYSSARYAIPVIEEPASSNTVVAYPTDPALIPYTDPYFRGFDNNLPDYYRFKEWEREFDAYYATGGLPSLTLLRLMHDHTGNFGTAIDLVNTPELMQADNDYAVGLVVQKIANSIYAQNTLIFVVEDDAQDGGDHVDSHRTIAFVAGAYVKQGAVVSTSYNTIDFVRTMEEVLGLNQFLNLNDALAHPMTDIFTTTPQTWTFSASPSAYLYATQLPLPTPSPGMKIPQSTHNAAYWARVTKGLDFSDADRVDPLLYNRILWKGMMHNRPYPPSLSLKNRHARDDDDERQIKSEKRPASYRPPVSEKRTRRTAPDKD